MEEGLVRGTVDSPLKEFAKYFHQAQNCLWGYHPHLITRNARMHKKRATY